LGGSIRYASKRSNKLKLRNPVSRPPANLPLFGKLIFAYLTITLILLSNFLPPNPEPRSNLPQDRWGHLDKYERKYARKIIIAYDEIMQLTEDIPEIASRYNLSVEDVRRAKDYAFGSGVSRHQFLPDEDMAAA